MSKERRGPPELQEEIATANNKAIAEVNRKFPGAPVGQVNAKGEQEIVRINAMMLWPPDRAVVTEEDVKDAWKAHLEAFHDWRDTPRTLRETQDAYVKLQAAGEALLWTFRYYAQDQFALGFAFAKSKYEQVKPKAEAA